MSYAKNFITCYKRYSEIASQKSWAQQRQPQFLSTTIMADILFEQVAVENRIPRSTNRPSLAQVKAIIAFMEKHPDLAMKKHKYNSHTKFKKLWVEFSNMVNSLEGSVKSTQGWIKFWSDKKRFLMIKQKQIEEGKVKSVLTPLEQKILDLCDKKSYTPRKKKKTVKEEPCNSDDLELDTDNVFVKGEDCNGLDSSRLSSETEDRHLTMIEKMVDVMDQQASAMLQIAQASLSNSKALAKLAESSHVQAIAVDRLVGTFETISTATHDIRNAILGIDYTLKRVYPTVQRQNSTLFS